MGVVQGLTKATLQVRSTLDAKTVSKSFDILNEAINLDTAQDTGDKLLVSNLAKAIYATSRRVIATAAVIGTSDDVMIYE